MRRAPIVVGATMAGLAAVLSFHTKSVPLTLGTLPAVAVPPNPSTTSLMNGTTSAAPATTNPTNVASTTAPSTTSSPATTNPPTTNPPTTNPPTTVLPPTKTATGAAVNYGYGVLSVSATVSGTKLTNVTIASINDGGNYRSESIDQQAVPVLEQEALQAQSASIQGVSGASYTSAGFQQSLQSALSQLGLR